MYERLKSLQGPSSQPHRRMACTVQACGSTLPGTYLPYHCMIARHPAPYQEHRNPAFAAKPQSSHHKIVAIAKMLFLRTFHKREGCMFITNRPTLASPDDPTMLSLATLKGVSGPTTTSDTPLFVFSPSPTRFLHPSPASTLWANASVRTLGVLSRYILLAFIFGFPFILPYLYSILILARHHGDTRKARPKASVMGNQSMEVPHSSYHSH